MDGEYFISPSEAIKLLKDRLIIHTFRNPSPGEIVGSNYSKHEIIEILKENADKIVISGTICRGLGYGLTVDDNGLLRIETNERKLNEAYPA